MASHFQREKHYVELLIRRLGQPACDCHDPNGLAGRETGADVSVAFDGRRIGIQVTEIDTGHPQGRARAEEKKLWRDSNPGTYALWAQNDRDKLLASIRGAVLRKVEIAEGTHLANLTAFGCSRTRACQRWDRSSRR
jgi:hypothetical protein